jgi:hypothetical protein
VEQASVADGRYVETDSATFDVERLTLQQSMQWVDENAKDALIDELVARSAGLVQFSFYPLVGSLFQQSGFPVLQGAQGDTSSRFDLVLIDDVDSIPVEIKSPTESRVINVKSIEQAVENKIVLDSRRPFPSRVGSATLVVGYEAPPRRSDVMTLIEAFDSAFGIRVGLITLRRLYEMALLSASGQAELRSTLSAAKGLI